MLLQPSCRLNKTYYISRYIGFIKIYKPSLMKFHESNTFSFQLHVCINWLAFRLNEIHLHSILLNASLNL